MEPNRLTGGQTNAMLETVLSRRGFLGMAAAGMLALSACGDGDPEQVGRSLLDRDVPLLGVRTPEIIAKQEYDAARDKAVLDSRNVANLIAASSIDSDRGTNWDKAGDKDNSVAEVIYGNPAALREFSGRQRDGDRDKQHMSIRITEEGLVTVSWGKGPQFVDGMQYVFGMAAGNPGLEVLDAEQPTAAMVLSTFQNPVWLSLHSIENRAEGWEITSVDAADTAQDGVDGRPWDTKPASGQDFSSLELSGGPIPAPQDIPRLGGLDNGLIPTTESAVESLNYVLNHIPQPPTGS